LRRRYFNIFVPARWLAKPTKWLASRNAGFGLVMPPKSKPKPETNHSARAQATFASQKVNSPGLDARGPLRGYLAAAAQRVGCVRGFFLHFFVSLFLCFSFIRIVCWVAYLDVGVRSHHLRPARRLPSRALAQGLLSAHRRDCSFYSHSSFQLR
jgi:hypothetical protein